MRVIIYLATNSRRSVPRVGNFVWNEEFGRFLYLGRPLTDLAEINQAAETVFDKPIRNLGHNVSMRVLADAEEQSAEEVPAEEVPAEEVPAEEVPAEEVPAEEVPAEEVPAEEVPAEEVPAEEVPAEEVPAEEVPAEEVPAEEVPAPKFVIVGNEILMDGKKVAGFTDPENHLRMAHGHAGLREEVEAFLQSK